ncbi:hypothetical protein MPDQ_007051 [Monascus purpureus]|uniref:Transcription factor CBF/NF-Y/archaeal histone domain-containing protein n=1 Tax=Monascus purpureus TaxID=5098 RepID=A0A507R2L2_MONPU|nr:hypothetical protein MPDQ_007051 [Monascus purpureus]BDD55535.1 hypothetical protein MAP00_001042 [Monascus purpureus]
MAPKHPDVSSDEITGQSALPISRIKKIIQLDDDVVQCSHNATFLITAATEMFIRYLAEQGHNVVKSERKPRKTIQYKDLATAVSRIDNLEFLADVIPRTTTYKQFKESKAKEAAKNNTVREKGQRTLNGTIPLHSKTNGEPMDPQNSPGSQAGTMNAHAPTSLSALMVEETAESSSAAPAGEDVEMAD